jgi:hypothetical protein
LSVCTAITRGGGRCRGIAIDSSGLCHAHHPDRAEARSRAASKGGKRGGRGRPMVEVHTIKDKLQDLADRVLDGSLDRAAAAVISQVYNVYLRALTTELKVREQQELVERLEELETLLESKGAGGRWGA